MPLLRVNPDDAWRMDLYLPFVLVYFFFNSLFLPMGLLYTTALSPLFYFWLLRQGKRWIVARLLLILAPFVFFHLHNGAQTKQYAVSFALAVAIYISAYTIYVFVNWNQRLSDFFLRVVVVNFFMSLIGVVLFYTPWDEAMWRRPEAVSEGIRLIRFQMFTYEPSYYCTLLAPFVLWTFFRFAQRTEPRNLALFLMTVIPLLMSYSLGAISAILIAIAGVHIWHLRHVIRRNYMLIGAPIGAAIAAFLLFSSNTFAARIQNFISGKDASGSVRTVLSYALAYFIAQQKSIWWGVGFGQIKIVGLDMTERFFGGGNGQLPCAIAETMAQFGFVGVAVRLGLELSFFYKTRVWKNYFRLALFLYIFVYQFTGSYLTNIAEYVIWILAFSPVFPEFAVEKAQASWYAWFIPRMRVLRPEPEPEPLH
jgi:hypothetical protein